MQMISLLIHIEPSEGLHHGVVAVSVLSCRFPGKWLEPTMESRLPLAILVTQVRNQNVKNGIHWQQTLSSAFFAPPAPLQKGSRQDNLETLL